MAAGSCCSWRVKCLGLHWVGHFSFLHTVGSFQSGGVFSGQRALTIECSLTSGCGQGCELVSGRSCGSSFQG